jgi:hypothetical protein
LPQLDTSIPLAPIDSTVPFVTGTEIETTERTVTGATEPKALSPPIPSDAQARTIKARVNGVTRTG